MEHDFRFWIADFGFKVFCQSRALVSNDLFCYWVERSDTSNPKSEI
ncbi:hypothetical protein D1AOALGA4SA_6291 [Olavius algarvensis Delta 1 endosymbiont]|nr:hypothetical protein D1AOALGA4SA_6291 [Olavius algarvensis Delta 1 endosymbiont]